LISIGYVARNISVGKPERDKALDKPRHKWKDNIKMDLRKRDLLPSGMGSRQSDMDSSWSGPVAGCYEHGTAPPFSIKAGMNSPSSLYCF
jgi:hypothetical protein